MTKTAPWTLSLLTNGPILAIGRESFCGHPLWTNAEEAVWLAPRQDGQRKYAALFNLSEEERTVPGRAAQYEGGKTAQELWSDQTVSTREGRFLPLRPMTPWSIWCNKHISENVCRPFCSRQTFFVLFLCTIDFPVLGRRTPFNLPEHPVKGRDGAESTPYRDLRHG